MTRNHLRKGGWICLCLCAGLLFAACNDDDDNPPTMTPNEMKLTKSVWGLSAATVSITADSTHASVTDSSIFQPCLEDDSVRFGSNHDYVLSDDSTNCDGMDILPYGEGIWAFTSAEDTLLIKPDGGNTLRWSVDGLSDSTLQVSFADSLGTDSLARIMTTKLTFEARANP